MSEELGPCVICATMLYSGKGDIFPVGHETVVKVSWCCGDCVRGLVKAEFEKLGGWEGHDKRVNAKRKPN